MDDAIVLVKSAKGRDAISGSSREISLNERRILIMIDGKRTVGELMRSASFLNNLAATLERLFQAGYAIRADAAGATSSPDPQGGGTLSAHARTVVEEELVEFLGPIAGLLCDEVLPAAGSLEQALLALSKQLDADQARQFRQKVVDRLARG